MKEKKTRYIILGLLQNQSLSGYEIREIISNSTAYFWQESDASIYPTLRLLAEEGMVASSPQFVGKRRKEVFTITEQGRNAFAEWFRRPPEVDARRQEFLLKLFFTTEETKDEMESHFKLHLRQLLTTLEALKEIEKRLQGPVEIPNKGFKMKTLKNGLAHIQLEIDWVRKNRK